MTEELDIRIVLDDNATLVGVATIGLDGTVTLTNPTFLIPDETGGVNFIPALTAMGIDASETEIVITKDKLKFGKSFLANPAIASDYKRSVGLTVLELPDEKKLIV